MPELKFEILTNLATLPSTVEFNFEELDRAIEEITSPYLTRVVTEDDLPSAEKDVTRLNKLIEFMETNRKDIKKAFLAPYEAFEIPYKAVLVKAQNAKENVKTQVDEFKDKAKEEKNALLKEFFDGNINELATMLSYDRIFDPKWLNKGTSIKKGCEEIKSKIEAILTSYSAIVDFGVEKHIENAMLSKLFETLDLAQAMQVKAKMEEEEEFLAEFKTTQAGLNGIVLLTEEIAQGSGGINTYDITGTFFGTTPTFRADMNALLRRHGIKFKKEV